MNRLHKIKELFEKIEAEYNELTPQEQEAIFKVHHANYSSFFDKQVAPALKIYEDLQVLYPKMQEAIDHIENGHPKVAQDILKTYLKGEVAKKI